MILAEWPKRLVKSSNEIARHPRLPRHKVYLSYFNYFVSIRQLIAVV